ncbi:putative bifunctional diguanylate cyclase/phosphodiesterase [Egicoccus halophilus]|uniref:GGDEF domain-containing protein n=1 Tax=Egicoccus halophilus TaxID=1670830 RepID=A0A8J3EYS9_9ACTN|nr:GGDEF domain-containing phosphodiesterase [Egicoccus halophilus]GGI08506.1 GGDEF domain-containing protein [Egicoccus halophilus]
MAHPPAPVLSATAAPPVAAGGSRSVDVEAQLRTIFELAPVGIGLVDLGGHTILTNGALRDLLGYSAEEFATMRFEQFTHPDDVARNLELFAELAAGGRERFEMDKRFFHRDGAVIWGRLTVSLLRDEAGRPDLAIGMLENVTEQRELQARLERLAFHDPLTLLANRELFRARVDACMHARPAPGRRGAVLFVDLDDFKTVNDSLGHAAGDELIRSVARRLRDSIRPDDTAGRLGGDEFAVLLDDLADPADAIEVAERLRLALERPHRLRGRSVIVPASVGVAYLADAPSTEAALRNADLAMYRAKRSGKSCVATYEPQLHRDALRRLELRSALGGALERGELTLVYQPVVDLVDAEPIGVEALLRWHHPPVGTVPPDAFVPLAEETGAIVPIGLWVLHEATAWLSGQWPAGGRPWSVSVNVSPVQLQPRLVGQVEAALQSSALAPERLVVEVTEQALMRQRSWDVVRDLKRLGVRIAIDDFGTGYSSLAYLSELAVDQLKIDRSFIASLGNGERTEAVPRAVIELARSLGLSVVAEGIETDAQWQRLLELGCRVGQGYRFARPMPPGELADLVDGPLASRPGTGATQAEVSASSMAVRSSSSSSSKASVSTPSSKRTR